MTRPNAERDYRDALAWCRAALEDDFEAVRVIVRNADTSGLVVALTVIIVDLMRRTPERPPLRQVDDLFDGVEEALAAADARRQLRDAPGHGSGDGPEHQA